MPASPALPGPSASLATDACAPGDVSHPAHLRLRLLLPLGLAMALSLTGDSTLYAVLPDRPEAAGVTLALVGLLLAANRIIRIPGNLVAGTLYDRSGRRALFLAGLALGVLSTLGYSVARGLWPWLGTRVMWGIAWSLINVGGYTMVLDSSGPRDRGRMMGAYQLVYALGLAISPMLGGVLTDTFGFRPALQICAAVSALGAAAAVVALPETKHPSLAQPAAGGATLFGWVQGLAAALRRPAWDALRARYVYLAVFFVDGGILMSTLSLYVERRWGDGILLVGQRVGAATLSGGLLAVCSIAAMLAGPTAGFFSDRLRASRRRQGPTGRWPVAWAGLVLGIAGFLLLARATSAAFTVLGVALVAGGAGTSIAGVAALAGDLAAQERPGAAMGNMAAAGDIGSAAGPLVAYALAGRVGLDTQYLLGAAVLLSALLVCARAGASARAGATGDR